MKKILPIIFCILTQIGFSQNNMRSKEVFLEAEYYLLFEDYIEAVRLYQRIYNVEKSNANIEYRIGQCYLNIAYEKQKAIPYLENAVQNISKKYKEGLYRETKAPLISLFYLGNAYRINNQLDDAINYYIKFRSLLQPKDNFNVNFVDQQIQNCMNAQELMEKSVTISKTNLGKRINTRFPNTNCVVSGNGKVLIYTSKLKFYDAIYYTKKVNDGWATSKNITPLLRSEGKCYSTSLSYDGKTLLIYLGGKYGGDIYISTFNDKNMKWSLIKKLNKNINSRYWETHASLSPDEKTIYFSSDRKGGFGGIDIYKSKFNEESNDWSEAINLGPIINTPFNDECAYLTNNGKVIYFSSQGHFNMGGYDIFYAKKIDDNTWGEPINIGYPINTTDDNLFFHPTQDGTFAYYSDYDKNGYGNEDIFLIEIFFEKNPFSCAIKGGLTLQANKHEIEMNKFKISFKDLENNKKIATINPDKKTGQYSYKLPPGNYIVNFKGEGYNEINKQLYIPKTNMEKEIILNVELKPY